MLVLVMLAVIGGPTVHLTRPPQFVPPVAMADVPCDMTKPMADAGNSAPTTPCKGMTADCIKQMGCVTNVAAPIRVVSTEIVFAFSLVAYWSARSEMAGVVREPEDLPPRTA